MEVNRPKECEVLADVLKVDSPPCEDICVAGRFPSYRKDRRPEGCWAAHTTLTAIEYLRLKRRLKRALEGRGIKWELVEEASILHDVGKLSEAYVTGRNVQHNVLSFVVALSICEDRVVPTSILLHHEAMHWRDLYRQPFSALQRLQRTIDMRRITRGFSLHENWRDAVMAVKRMLEILEMKHASSILDILLKNRKYRANSNQINRCLRWNRHLSKALILYWILYLIDNRAASARDGLEAYWLRSLDGLCEYSRKPSLLADMILRSIKRADVSLTAIPEPRVIECL